MFLLVILLALLKESTWSSNTVIMGRYRSRSRSYSPRHSRNSPRRKRYDDPRDRYRGSHRDRRSSGPSGLLVRNISLNARPDDLRIPFERFGPVKDVYIPKNYYTGEPRGFGFVKFHNAEDASEAKERMNHQVIGGREIRIVFAEENRKTPQEMRRSTRISDRYGGGYRRRSPRSPRRQYRSYSRSPSPARRNSRYSRSPSPNRRDSRYSRSPSSARHDSKDSRSPSPVRHDSRERDHGDRSPRGSISRSSSPRDEKDTSDQRSPSPRGSGRSPLRSRSYSPN